MANPTGDAGLQLRSRLATRLNRDWHEAGLWAFLVLVALHISEHVVQAVQVYVLGMPRPEALGLLGHWFPHLVESETLHFGYAFLTLLGLILLKPAFSGRARTWWNVALGVALWHVVEHTLLLLQVVGSLTLFGAAAPTSILQLVVPRVELHLFYNAATALPLLAGALLHLRPHWDPEAGRRACRPLAAVEAQRAADPQP